MLGRWAQVPLQAREAPRGQREGSAGPLLGVQEARLPRRMLGLRTRVPGVLALEVSRLPGVLRVPVATPTLVG